MTVFSVSDVQQMDTSPETQPCQQRLDLVQRETAIQTADVIRTRLFCHVRDSYEWWEIWVL